MDCEDCMTSWRCHVYTVITNSAVLFTFKEAVKCFFLIPTMSHGQSLDYNFIIWCILDSDWTSRLLMRWYRGEHIKHQFIVDLYEWNLNRDCIIETAAHFGEYSIDTPWHKTTIFVIRGRSTHSEGLTSSSLTIAHNCTVKSIDHFMHGLLSTVFEDIFLWGVVKNLVEFEFPRLLLVVHYSFASVLSNTDRDRLIEKMSASAVDDLHLYSGQFRCFCLQSLALVLF